MSINGHQPKKKGDEIPLSFTSITVFLIKQTQTKQQETLEFKMNKPTETVCFDNPSNFEDNGMFGLPGL